MKAINIPPRPANGRVVRCRQPEVYVDGVRRRDLMVLQWEMLGPPQFGRLTLAPALIVPGQVQSRFGDPGCLPEIGAAVRVSSESSGRLFVGAVSAHRHEVGPGDERLVAECSDLLAGALAEKVASHWRAEEGTGLQVTRSPARFNVDRAGLASACRVTINGRECRAFDSGLSAERWTVAGALEYMLAVYAPPAVEPLGQGELEALAGVIDLGAVDATGKTAAQVIREVLDRGGLDMRAGREGESLVVYKPGAAGRRRNVGLQPVGDGLDQARTNLWRGRIAFTRRPSRRGVLVLGARKQFESTFELSEGWDPKLATDRWRDFVRSLSDDWPRVAAVYRKWVLNEHGWYSGEPWSLPVHDFADISGEDFTTRSPRRFLPCLSSDSLGQSLGIVVEARCSSTGPWRRWPGPVWAAQEQCAVHLGGDSLPADYFQAAVAGTAEVRVTAVIEADARLSAEVEGNPHLPKEVVDASSQAFWREVRPTSIFRAAAGLGPADESDDSELVRRIASRNADLSSLATEAEITLGWIDTSFQVGDIIERIEGRDFELSSNADARPCVRSVVHDFGQAQTTRLIVRG